MELEAADAVIRHQPADPLDRLIDLMRVDRPERDQHIGVIGSGVGDLEARQRRMAERRRRVDREDHRRHRECPIVLGEPFDGGRSIGGRLEVLGRGVEQLLIERQAPMAVLFDVNVHVDGDERLDIDRRHHCGHQG